MNREDFKLERAAREAEARLFHGRRQFAGIALRAILEDYSSAVELKHAGKWAKLAFDWADAMLAEEKARYGS